MHAGNSTSREFIAVILNGWGHTAEGVWIDRCSGSKWWAVDIFGGCDPHPVRGGDGKRLPRGPRLCR